jgi:predicted helicase
MYGGQLFANEIMLLPYYVSALNIEHAFYEETGAYAPFEGLCFVDTLDLAEGRQKHLSFMTEQNTARVERQKQTPITVIIGNPPYNANQVNENDNNKNRAYPLIDRRIKATYVKRNSARKTKLYDPYVRFFRWATDRLGNNDGIVCFVTNNSFVHTSACDGLQRCLTTEFSTIFHLDLKGRVRQNPTLSGTAYNVFGIRLGVGITIAIRKGKPRRATVYYAEVELEWRRAEKLAWLSRVRSVAGIEWRKIQPDDELLWLRRARGSRERGERGGIPIGTEAAKSAPGAVEGVIFKTYSLGVSTNRDEVVYDFDEGALRDKMARFCDAYAAEIDRLRRWNPQRPLEQFFADCRIKLSRNLKRRLVAGDELAFDPGVLRTVLYRPFTKRALYCARIAVDELGLMPRFLPSKAAERTNRLIVLTGPGSEKPFVVLATGKCERLESRWKICSVGRVVRRFTYFPP